MSSKLVKKVRYALRFLPDDLYIQLNYLAIFKKKANLKHPVTYNEKLNWLKLHDHNTSYTSLVDKFEVKKYIEKQIGEKYIIPTLGVWNKFEDINFDTLPNQFVLKCTHDSNGLVIVKDKSAFNKKAARDKIAHCLKQNFYYFGREWPYKNVKPRIIAEPYIEDSNLKELRDYKFFCFNGEPKIMYVASGRSSNRLCFDCFDMEFTHLDILQKYPNSNALIQKPDSFNEMIRLAKILSKGFTHVRVDLYDVDGNVYFGELTFYHHSGFMPFNPPIWDNILGDWIKLPNS